VKLPELVAGSNQNNNNTEDNGQGRCTTTISSVNIRGYQYSMIHISSMTDGDNDNIVFNNNHDNGQGRCTTTISRRNHMIAVALFFSAANHFILVLVGES